MSNLFEVRDKEGNIRRYISILSHDFVFDKGLISEAILGEVVGSADDGRITEFRPNPVFLNLLHRTIEENGINAKPLIDEALRQYDGVVVVIDGRVKNKDDGVPPEDIIGLFSVVDGQLAEYKPNPNYLLYTNKGFMILEKSLHSCLERVVFEKYENT
ncbi:hypothetical protein [Microbulbifer thermotolerans]|uniref:Uncharacterized protein n=1 Tax=Microbulbifer thermotolerans TaxID=252514 RepID=A0AB35HW93_MICTH|nr:hypothetical protein [Microbulbifer thermotolerans]MCX2801520.1 hypothetical protein [Microbulbifer thermotolerans]MCX2833120.1 hypothetical protein [Microbulbifer thermotolerans]